MKKNYISQKQLLLNTANQKIKSLTAAKNNGYYTYLTVLFTVLFLFQTVNCMAKQITQDETLRTAKKFYSEHLITGPSKIRNVINPEFKLVYISSDSESSNNDRKLSKALSDTLACFYIYNVGEKQGFVIVSADDSTYPVLGYSMEGCFLSEHIPANVQSWLNFYKSEIEYAIKISLNASLLDSDSIQPITKIKSSAFVEPLLGKIKWDQSYPFNLLCPYDSISKTHALAGCVALPMAQIMKYHNWPITGSGTKKYTSDTFGQISVDFSKTKYDWANMNDSYGSASTPIQDTAVATLIYQCGVAIEMDYGIQSSNAYPMNAGIALKNYFGYDKNIQIYSRNYFTSSEWDTKIKNELNAARPILYSGHTNSEGHAFTCDGYDTNDMFHINWGWGGYCNGYFEMNTMKYDYSGNEGVTGGFNKYQQIITGIHKPDSISNVTYLLDVNTTGLTSSIAYLSSINDQKIALSFGFYNDGLNNFSGKFGVGLFKDGVFQEVITSSYVANLTPNYGYSKIQFSNISLKRLKPGKYEIFCIYQPVDSIVWTKMNKDYQFNNSLDITITGIIATIQKPTTIPKLILTQPIEQVWKTYNNKTANFSFKIQNSGSEFFSNIGIFIYSTQDISIGQYIDYGVVCVPAGETKIFTLSGVINSPAGSYYAKVICDSTNSYSTKDFKMIGPVSYNPIQIAILSEPTDPVLVLNNPISLSKVSTIINKNEDIVLNSSIHNDGGYFDSQIVAFVFPEKGGSSIGYLNPKTIYIDTNENLNIQFTGSLDLDPGKYFFGLSYYINGWVDFSPVKSEMLAFTMTDLSTNINELAQTEYSILPNPVFESFKLKGIVDKCLLKLIDIHGKLILTKQVNANEEISLKLLPKGIYFVQLRNEKMNVLLKLIKE